MSRFLMTALITLAVSSSAFAQGVIAPTCGTDQQLDGRGLGRRAGRIRLELLEPGDPERAAS